MLVVPTTMKRHWRSLSREGGRGFVCASRYLSLDPHAPRGNLNFPSSCLQGFFAISSFCSVPDLERERLGFAVAEGYRFLIKRLSEKG